MSQIFTSPIAYRNALQKSRRKYGHPHLVVRMHSQGLMNLPVVRAEKIKAFFLHLRGVVSTLESAGYGHELDSSVALVVMSLGKHSSSKDSEILSVRRFFDEK